MADPRESQPDFGTREEDRPGIDADPDTEEGREAIRRTELALHTSIGRSIERRRLAQKQAYDSLYPDIPEALYVKAETQQEALTEAERHLLLSRPDSLTKAEMYAVLMYPSPSVVSSNIQRVTNGVFSTPGEVYATAKGVLDRGQPLTTVLTDEAIALPLRLFHAVGDDRFMRAFMARGRVPGKQQASNLLHNRLGLGDDVLRACCTQSAKQMRQPQRPDGTLIIRRPVRETIMLLQMLYNAHDHGITSDQNVVARSAEYLQELQEGYQPVTHLHVDELIASMTALRGQCELHNITDQEFADGSKQTLSNYKAAVAPYAPIPSSNLPAHIMSENYLAGTNLQPFQPAPALEQSSSSSQDWPLAPDTPPLYRYPENLSIPGAPRERMSGLVSRPTPITGFKVFRDEQGPVVALEHAMTLYLALTEEHRSTYVDKAKALYDIPAI